MDLNLHLVSNRRIQDEGVYMPLPSSYVLAIYMLYKPHIFQMQYRFIRLKFLGKTKYLIHFNGSLLKELASSFDEGYKEAVKLEILHSLTIIHNRLINKLLEIF